MHVLHCTQAQLQLANAQLFSVGALAWELSRVSSMLLPALLGSTALPLATGRPAFINASGTAPIMPMRVQPGLAGLNMLGEPTLQSHSDRDPCFDLKTADDSKCVVLGATQGAVVCQALGEPCNSSRRAAPQ